MKPFRSVLGPLSKYDKTIPYTYMAKVKEIEETADFSYYFADTICGLVEFLNKEGISPQETELMGIYKKEEFLLDNQCCISQSGQWLLKPDICLSVESYYKKTLNEAYKGHIANGICSFDDRDTTGSGPY